MTKVVLDTSVVVAALRSRSGASNEVLRRLARGRFEALATPALFLEYEEVLKRPEQISAHGLDNEQLDQLLSSLASVLRPVDIHIAWRPQLRDPSDEMVLEAAINGSADAIVTFNVKDFVSAAARFGLEVWSPQELLKRSMK